MAAEPSPCSRRAFLLAALSGAGTALAGCSSPGAAARLLGPLATPPAPRQVELATVFDSPRRVREPTVTSAMLMMVGDVLVHRGVWKTGERADGTYNFDHLFQHVADDFSSADIAMVNQETILGGTEMGLEGFPTFNSPQEIGDAEARAGVDVAVSATNHSMDQGFEGIERTRSFWRERHPGVRCVGISDTEEASREICLLERSGITFAIFSYTATTNGIPLPAGKGWCVSMLGRSDIAGDVARARAAGADIVVACPHTGTEYSLQPSAEQRRWAQAFLKAGVDVMIGHHPHVIEPVEVLDRSDGHRMVAFWSLGNFVSSQTELERVVGGMARVAVERRADAVRVAGYSMGLLVNHCARGTEMGVYRMADYTDELAARNLVNLSSTGGSLSMGWIRSFGSKVLGEGFDPATGALSVTL